MKEPLPSLVEVRRGAIVEARHRGAIVAVEPDGRIVASLGHPGLTVSTRSVIKPIQAIPIITSGAADRFEITSSELAVICASHQGEPMHTGSVAAVLTRIGLDEGALMCGAHRPYSEEIASDLERCNRPFTQLHNNCSGKHTGMLATAIHMGLPIENYVSPEHPVQRAIISTFTRIAGFGGSLQVAVDGCSAPTFGVPLISLAVAFSRLVNPWGASQGKPRAAPADREPPSPIGADEAVAAKWIVAAMQAHPEMVGGSRGRLDTDLMRVARGKLIGKIGAEAVYAIGVLPGSRFPRGLGIAVKIEDGTRRALTPVVVETLAQLEVLSEDEQARLAEYHRPAVQNHRNLSVGEIRPVFDLLAAIRRL